MEPKDYIKISKNNIKKIQEKIELEISNYSKKSDVRVEDYTTLTNTTIEIEEKKEIKPDTIRKEYDKHYNELSKEKVKGTALKQSKKYAEIIYQPTTRAKLHLKDKSSTIATIRINRLLPEHSQQFANYWIDQYIESGTIKEQVKHFGNKMKQNNISNVQLENYTGKNGIISQVKVEIEYA